MKNLLFGSLLAVAMLSLSGCYGTANNANTTKSVCNAANCDKGMKCGAGKCGKDMKKPAAKCGGGKCGSGK